MERGWMRLFSHQMATKIKRLQLFLAYPPPQIVPLQVALALLLLLMSSAHAGDMRSVYKAIWDLACLAEHFENSF